MQVFKQLFTIFKVCCSIEFQTFNKVLKHFILTTNESYKAQGLYYKTFFGRNLRIIMISQSVCIWQAFTAQSNVCVGAYPGEAPFRCSTLGYAPGLTHKHQSRQERLARDKQSSLIRKSVDYDRKKFYSTGPLRAFELERPSLFRFVWPMA